MRSFTIKVLTVLITLSSIIFSAIAQHAIKGRVVGNDSEVPLPGANILIKSLSRATVTDIEGYFSMKDLPAGLFKIEITYVGYQNHIQTLDIPYTGDYNVTLKESVAITDELLVTATRASENTPTTFSTISNEDIDKINLGQDLPFLLNQTPSVVVTSDAGAGVGYTGIRIRGSDNTRTNVTVNGVPINDSESHGVFWVNMPDLASSIENIQIQRGVGTSTNGAGAFGASINVQTNTLKPQPYAEIDNSFGSFNTRKHTVSAGSGLINDRFAVDMRLSAINSDGYIDRARSDLKSYYLAGGYYGDKTMIKAIAFSGREETYQAWYGTPESRLNNDEEAMREHAINEGYSEEQLQNLLNSGRTYNFYTYDNEVDNYQQDHYQLHLSQEIISNLDFNGALHYTKGRGYFEQYRADESLEEYGLDLIVTGEDTTASTDLIRRRWLDNDFYGFTYGLQYNPKRLSLTLGGGYNIYKGDHFGEVIWARFASNSEIRDRYYDNEATKTDFNVYLKGNFELTDKLHVYGDLQYRAITYEAFGADNDQQLIDLNENFNFFNPKFGLMYSLDDHTNVYASYAVANREPVRNDFIDAPQGQKPVHETLRNIEAGIKGNKKAFSYAINYFLMDYKNQLVLTGELNDVGSTVRTNVANSYRTGLELNAAFQLSEKFMVSGNVALSRNKIRNFEETVYDYTEGFDIISNQYEDTDISYSPGIVAGGEIRINPFKGFEINLFPKYVGEQYLDNTSNEERKIEGYFVSDLRFAYSFSTKWSKEIGLNLMVNNILDTEYVSNGFTYSYIYGSEITENFYYPQAGINFMAGLSLKF